jgi:hypothetical protein
MLPASAGLLIGQAIALSSFSIVVNSNGHSDAQNESTTARLITRPIDASGGEVYFEDRGVLRLTFKRVDPPGPDMCLSDC